MKKIIMSTIAMLYLSHTAFATTFFVSPSGSNANSCAQAQNSGTPKQSFGNFGGMGVITCLAAGDTVMVRGGTYPEAIYFNVQPYPGLASSNPPVPNGIDDMHRTTIQAFPGEHPVLTQQDPDNGGLDVHGAQFIQWDGIDIDGTGWSRTSPASIVGAVTNDGAGTQNATFQNFTFKNIPWNGFLLGNGGEGAINHLHFNNIKSVGGADACVSSPGPHVFYIGPESGTSIDVVIDGLEVTGWNATNLDCGNGYAVQIYHSGAGTNIVMDGYIVRNSYFHDNTDPALVIGTGRNMVVYNNVFVNNGASNDSGESAVDLGFNLTENALIANNTFYKNVGGIALAVGPFGIVNNSRLSNNILWQNVPDDTIGMVSGTDTTMFHFTTDHNLQGVDPLFVNAAAGDFHLLSGSPATGAGADLSTFFTTDKDGTVRTAPWTIGAFSGSGGGPIPPTITTVSLPNGVVGTAYNATMTATGGTPPYTWSATGLPAGLNMSAGGVITGTPSVSGTSQVIVTVTDSMALTATKQLSLMVSTTATTLTMSIASGPCTLAGTLTITPVLTNWSFPGVTVSTNAAPATCTVRIHDNSPTNPAPDVISAPFTVSADGGIIPSLQFTQQPTNTVSGHAFAPPVAGTRQ